jgi:3-methyladenine DNA glycosylase AlkD
MARQATSLDEALAALKEHASEEDRLGMARFGVSPADGLGVRMPKIREIGQKIKPDHELAAELWASGVHEARILASLVDRPKWVDLAQMLGWAADFDTWDICDQACGNLFDKCDAVDDFIAETWHDPREFVRRAAFATIAWRAVHGKKAEDSLFQGYLTLISHAADDDRNFVKKAVNWALRQIGKRSLSLHGPALELAKDLTHRAEASAQWIGKDAVRELESTSIIARLSK